MDFSNVKQALVRNHFAVSVFDTAEEASDYLNREIDKTTVGLGGSVTLEQMKLFESLSTHNKVLSHWHLPTGMDARSEQKEAMLTEIYICSVNAISEDGTIVNIDGAGNRIASSIYGHEKVYFVVGRNKVVPTFEDAVYRARNIAAPKNAQRLKKRTPCAINADKCYNCKSPDRICRAMTILWQCVMRNEIEVVLVDEDMGF